MKRRMEKIVVGVNGFEPDEFEVVIEGTKEDGSALWDCSPRVPNNYFYGRTFFYRIIIVTHW